MLNSVRGKNIIAKLGNSGIELLWMFAAFL